MELRKKILTLQERLKNNKFKEVIEEANLLKQNIKITETDKEIVTVLFNILSLAYQNILDFQSSIQIMDEGLAFDKKNKFFLNNIAISYHKIKDYQRAESYFQRALEEDPKYINVLNNYGNLKKDLDQIEEAIVLFEKSVKLNANILVTNFNLSSMYIAKGNYNKAKYYLNRILKSEPNFTKADRALSIITDYSENDEHLKDMESRLNKIKFKNIEKIDLHFALGKAFEDLKQYDKAYLNFEKANSYKREIIDYNIEDDVKLFKNLKNFFSEKRKLKVNKNKRNFIFILGMPRSGTSLVEQIISSHPEVYGGGELVYLSDLIRDKVFKNDKIIINDKILKDIQSSYMSEINLLNKVKFNVTDKSPLNFRWVGFINEIFPNSKIIHCERDPLENCWSIFKNNFEAGLSFAFKIEELGQYYKIYKDLMKFWNQIYTNKIYNIKYENLINKNSDEVKSLLKFCNLKWDAKCLKHHENKRIIKTLSTLQARSPIYKSSLEITKRYGKNLLAFKEMLRV